MSVEFRIEGMDCAEEVAILKRELGPLVGGEERLAFDLLQGKLTVATEGLAAETVVRAVAGTGMKAERWQDSQQVPFVGPWGSVRVSKQSGSTVTARRR